MSEWLDHEHCDACGFDGSTYDDASLLEAVNELGPRWKTLLESAGPGLRVRPESRTWSAIEYAAHSRDVTALHAFGVEQALIESEPVYPPIDGDDLIEAASVGYMDEELEPVVDSLNFEARRLAQLASTAGVPAWQRGLTIGDNRSTVRRLIEHALHDSVHHLDDVERGLQHLEAPGPAAP